MTKHCKKSCYIDVRLKYWKCSAIEAIAYAIQKHLNATTEVIAYHSI